MSNIFFTSESVTEGHPDKICDKISDAVLDAILAKDSESRVACEVIVKTGLVFVFGEIRTSAYVDIESIARRVIKDIGYTRAKYGFDYETCSVINAIGAQSPDIAQGVDEGTDKELGAGDQGMMFGFACNETDDYMPLPISLAHRLAKELSLLRKENILDYLRPDGKTQVTVEYDRATQKPLRVDAVVVSTQHDPSISQEKIKHDIKERLIKPVLGKMFDEKTTLYINPTGKFVIGGPQGDAGLTGRKIIVDTYGGYTAHGGGAFSGKDPSKVDRSGAYMARYIAKNIVAAELADKCSIELSYAIGISHPLSILVNTSGTGKMEDSQLEDIVKKVFDCRPAAIIEALNLKNPIYEKTASYGHFGENSKDMPWEQLNKVRELQVFL
ncbi:methionine adenosyltransferase [Candidatus Peregrinibacteria bacterium]|jgi:S-adenosylmethionine synthetase|nr:methionine adenosyltransferase [Candidatus Peregrinibacteria bacterium]